MISIAIMTEQRYAQQMERVYTHLYGALKWPEFHHSTHTLSDVQYIHMFRLFRLNAVCFFIIIHPILLALCACVWL